MSAFFSNVDVPLHFADPAPLSGSGQTGSLPPSASLQEIVNGLDVPTMVNPTPFSGSGLTGSLPLDGRATDGPPSRSQATQWTVVPGQRPGTHKSFFPGID